MEYILNELSFHNQFKSFEDFKDSALLELLKFLSLCDTDFILILKKTDIYSREVYDRISLHDILISRNHVGKSDEIRKLKSQLSKILYDPFWDTESRCEVGHKYLHNGNDVCNSSLAESFERKCDLISLNNSMFKVDTVEVSKNGLTKKLHNHLIFKKFILYLYNNDIIDFEYYCKRYYNKTKLDFSRTNRQQSFDFLNDRNDQNEFINSFDMFVNLEWGDILAQGGKGPNKAGLAFGSYHNQSYFSGYNPEGEICKFRTSQKFRVFGFRKAEIFYVLEFDLTHRLSD